MLDRLDALAARVARSEADRAVVNRILEGETDDLVDDAKEWCVPRLTEDVPPRIPTVHDAEDPKDKTLEDMWVRD
ncbi:hypothetical protein FE633_04640 [Streptomyces montanus]|uniref:Uncharacterized protein n=1 Tax=Streptomyces montanus TaxID=2580423 RepID=A0A5R9FV56_9ACTN|nr:hypothetical protein [Streptomyces montanus]TLS47321.1 hypothetical protein FE633_04640 [Streptomyces montanus]